MDQLTFGDADFAGKGKRTRKERFLAEMDLVVPWSVLVRLIEPVYFRVVKCVFHYTKTRFKGLAKNTVQIMTLFALANLYAVRKQLLPKTGQLRPQFG